MLCAWQMSNIWNFNIWRFAFVCLSVCENINCLLRILSDHCQHAGEGRITHQREPQGSAVWVEPLEAGRRPTALHQVLTLQLRDSRLELWLASESVTGSADWCQGVTITAAAAYTAGVSCSRGVVRCHSTSPTHAILISRAATFSRLSVGSNRCQAGGV